MQVANSAGHASSPLAGYGNLSLRVSVQTKSGGAEIHAHLDDLMIVQQGKATLITGGTLIQRQELANGGAKGAGIQNGVSQEINAGDVILIPAGVPHQLVVPAGTVYAALVAKVKEPE
jgi:mannose-6-phosphate isomerase-like protein (cupin superfamily)